ncbi:mediator of RNA polymerase II transcription subunit 1 like protein, partial [Tanacetum coccineum]
EASNNHWGSCIFCMARRNARIFRGEVRTVDDLFSTIIDTIKMRVVKFKVKRSKAVKTLERNWELKFLVKSMMMPSSVLLPSLIVSGVAAVGLCGLVGSLFANRGFISGAHDLYSGANKVLKLLSNNEKSGSRPKPNSNNSLMAQVNNLRQELQLLASNQQVTIVTSTKSGSTSKYKIIVIVVVVGYGYAWWKGWKLPNMMFATKRSLSDAMNVVAKKLDDVYSSLAVSLLLCNYF